MTVEPIISTMNMPIIATNEMRLIHFSSLGRWGTGAADGVLMHRILLDRERTIADRSATFRHPPNMRAPYTVLLPHDTEGDRGA